MLEGLVAYNDWASDRRTAAAGEVRRVIGLIALPHTHPLWLPVAAVAPGN